MPPRQVVYKPSAKPKEIHRGGTLQAPKYMPTYFEWLVVHGDLIIRNTNAIQTGKLFYTVPKGKIFFLVACSMNSENVSGGGSFNSKLAVDQQAFSFGASTPLLEISATDEISGATAYAVNKSTSQSFPIPLKFIEGWKFYAYDNPSAQGNSECCIQGYEIDANLFELGI